jgi:hypothetical protein
MMSDHGMKSHLIRTSILRRGFAHSKLEPLAGDTVNEVEGFIE